MDYVRKIGPFHTDDRGWLAYLSDPEIKIRDVLYIVSNKGAVRANHYHRKDIHYIYLVSGKLECTSKNMKDPNSEPVVQVIGPGEMYISPPYIAHKVVALEDSEFVVLTTEPRDQKNYEEDTIRVEL